MKRKFATLPLVLLGMTLLLVSATPAPAHADTDVAISVTADAYAIDDAGQITSNNEFLYNSARGDDLGNAYQIAYRGNLDMRELWVSYRTFKLLWRLGAGNTQAKWEEKAFSGHWHISLQIDTKVVSSNPESIDCEALQAEVESQNPDTHLAQFIRCTEVTYDASNGTYRAEFTLVNEDGSKVTGKQLDENQSPSLHLTTPTHAFYVKQSNFEVGKSFAMTEPTVSGEMRMDAFFHQMMPLRFDAVGNDVTLTMAETFDALHQFESGTPERALPPGVTDLTPAPQTMLVSGASVTPVDPQETSVRDGQGTWEFSGWDPASAVVQQENIMFTATWVYAVDPDARFLVEHRFQSREAEALPQEILALLPAESVALQGSTVEPGAPAQTSVTTAAGTWSFDGWNVASQVVNGTSIEFVGTWSFAAKVAANVNHNTLVATGGTSSALPATAGIALLLAGAIVLTVRFRRRTHAAA